ncbi:MAG: hypothetical protein FH761_15910 [Firmicutes bacterium]|nr:hypothetical protein [Bacillota bacterium]
MIFLISSIIIFNLIAIFMPKYITKYEIFTTILFALLFQTLTDVFLNGKYHLYYYFSIEINWISLIPMFGLYPAFNTIYLNYYVLKDKWTTKVWYILRWVLFSLAFEGLSVQAGYFFYNGWKLWYSALCYPIIYVILAFSLHITQSLTKYDL